MARGPGWRACGGPRGCARLPLLRSVGARAGLGCGADGLEQQALRFLVLAGDRASGPRCASSARSCTSGRSNSPPREIRSVPRSCATSPGSSGPAVASGGPGSSSRRRSRRCWQLAGPAGAADAKVMLCRRPDNDRARGNRLASARTKRSRSSRDFHGGRSWFRRTRCGRTGCRQPDSTWRRSAGPICRSPSRRSSACRSGSLGEVPTRRSALLERGLGRARGHPSWHRTRHRSGRQSNVAAMGRNQLAAVLLGSLGAGRGPLGDRAGGCASFGGAACR